MSRPVAPGPILAVDIGNSRVKIAAVRDAGVELLAEGETRRVAEIIGALALPAWPAHLASVAAGATQPAIDALLAKGAAPVRLAGRDLRVPLRLDYRTPETLGWDRVLAALAAWREAGRASWVVSAGTAVTADVVSADGSFRGGAIAPGLASLGPALHAAAPALEAVEPDPAASYPGASTRECLAAGITAGARGLLRELVRLASGAAGPGAWGCLTGGQAALAAALLGPDAPPVRPHLVLRGLALADPVDGGG